MASRVDASCTTSTTSFEKDSVADANIMCAILAEDIRINSHEALLPSDLEYAQLNRARLTSYGVLREKSKQTVSAEVTQMHEPRNRKVHHTRPNGHLCKFGKGKGKQGKGKHGKGKGKGKDSKDSTDRLKDFWSLQNIGSKGEHKPKNAASHTFDSKTTTVEIEVEIDDIPQC